MSQDQCCLFVFLKRKIHGLTVCLPHPINSLTAQQTRKRITSLSLADVNRKDALSANNRQICEFVFHADSWVVSLNYVFLMYLSPRT